VWRRSAAASAMDWQHTSYCVASTPDSCTSMPSTSMAFVSHDSCSGAIWRPAMAAHAARRAAALQKLADGWPRSTGVGHDDARAAERPSASMAAGASSMAGAPPSRAPCSSATATSFDGRGQAAKRSSARGHVALRFGHPSKKARHVALRIGHAPGKRMRQRRKCYFQPPSTRSAKPHGRAHPCSGVSCFDSHVTSHLSRLAPQ